MKAGFIIWEVGKALGARQVPKRDKSVHKGAAEKATDQCYLSLYYRVLAVALRVQFGTLQISVYLFCPSIPY